MNKKLKAFKLALSHKIPQRVVAYLLSKGVSVVSYQSPNEKNWIKEGIKKKADIFVSINGFYPTASHKKSRRMYVNITTADEEWICEEIMLILKRTAQLKYGIRHTE